MAAAEGVGEKWKQTEECGKASGLTGPFRFLLKVARRNVCFTLILFAFGKGVELITFPPEGIIQL